jgi:predicted ATPase
MVNNYTKQVKNMFPIGLTVKNFKSLKDNSVRLDALTVLLGSNSCGKTSIIQAILLMAMNSNTEKPEDFIFNGPVVSLGTPSSLLTKTSEKKHATSMQLGLELEIREDNDQIPRSAGINILLELKKGNSNLGTMQLRTFEQSQSSGELHTQLVMKTIRENKVSDNVATQVSINGDYITESRVRNRDNFFLDGPFVPIQEIGLGDLSSEKRTRHFIKARTWLKPGDRFLPTVDSDRPIFILGDITTSCLEYCGDRLIAEYMSQKKASKNLNPDELSEVVTQVVEKVKRAKAEVIGKTISDPIAEQFVNELEQLVDGSNSNLILQHIANHFRNKNHSFDEKSLSIYKSYFEEKTSKGSSLSKKQYLLFPFSGRAERRNYESASKLNQEITSYLTNQVHYLGPLRAFSLSDQKFFPPISKLCPIGAKGESLSWVLSSEQMNVEDQYPFPPNTFDSPSEIRKAKFSDALDSWLRWFGLGEGFTLSEDGAWGRFIEIDSEKLSQKGTGISQVLPVVAICLLSKPGSLCLIEQPELHLHPSLQQKLGTFFAHMVGSKRRLILETHSEYLVTRLRREIAVGKLNHKDLSLCFVSKGTDNQMGDSVYSDVTQVEVSEFGLVDEWPQDYFDFTADDNLDIFEASARE